MYSWYQNGEYLNRYKNCTLESLNNTKFFIQNEENHYLIEKNPYIISLVSIIKFRLFKKILLESTDLNEFVNTPFNFEKSSRDINYLPIRKSILSREFFASIDDDLGVEGTSLIPRKLYIRNTRRESNYSKSIINKIKKIYYKHLGEKLRYLIMYLLTKRDYRSDFRDSFKGEKLENIPWINYKALDFLEKIVLPESKNVFEFGSGSSTLYFKNKGLNIESVEHNSKYFDEVLSKIGVKFIPPVIIDMDKENNYLSDQYFGYSFENYVNSIAGEKKYDVIFIDGRCRIECIKKSLQYLNNNGWIILNNSNRKRYKLNLPKELEDFEKYIFKSSVRGLLHMEETSFFRKK